MIIKYGKFGFLPAEFSLTADKVTNQATDGTENDWPIPPNGAVHLPADVASFDVDLKAEPPAVLTPGREEVWSC